MSNLGYDSKGECDMKNKLLAKLSKAKAEDKTDLWRDADLSVADADELVRQMILSLPGSYKLHSRKYGTSLVDAVYEKYGFMPSMRMSEEMLLGLQVAYPKQVYASFTLGLDKIEIL